MSGTSLDGVDAILVSFEDNLPPTLTNTYSHPIPKQLRAKILKIINPNWKGSLSEVGELHQELGHLFANAVNQLIKASSSNPEQIIAIGSHGQTVWHQPSGNYPFSLQLGDANQITEITGITTVADFRSRDIAAGGQGAPLVPAFHHQTLTHPTRNRVILNIGGIANISVLPSSENQSDIMGFDTGPGNGLMDAWISRHKNINYDKNGNWAGSGTVLENVLNQLLDDPYFKLVAPKSTGKEAFNLSWFEQKLGSELEKHNPEDIQATLLELSSKTIADNINDDCEELFVCGGGVHNQHLMKRLQEMLPAIKVASTAMLGIDPDWVEATAFAWLAKQTIEGKSGNLPITTGAKDFRILGAIYPK